MNNSVSSLPITFTLYSSLGVSNVALVVCIFVLYISGLCVNLFLIVVIFVESRLHRPMYILLANLALSGVMGSSCVCPNLIKHLVSQKQETSFAECLTQVFFTNVYSGCMFCILALMSYDRYVSICKPLKYHSIMTLAKVKLMLLVVYFTLSCTSAVQVLLTSRLELCRHSVDKLLCDTLAIANLSCSQTTLLSAYSLCCVVGVVVFPCFFVILSYVHIFTVVRKTSKESRMKGLQTCIPHFVTFVNFSLACFFGVTYTRLSHKVPKAVSIFTCINFFVSPPLLHPIIYGIKMQEIQQSMKKLLRQRIIQR